MCLALVLLICVLPVLLLVIFVMRYPFLTLTLVFVPVFFPLDNLCLFWVTTCTVAISPRGPGPIHIRY